MCATHALKLEGADHVGGQLLSVRQGDTHHPVSFCSPSRPVLVTLHSRPFLQPGQHHYCGAPLLPNKSPEICKRLW